MNYELTVISRNAEIMLEMKRPPRVPIECPYTSGTKKSYDNVWWPQLCDYCTKRIKWT